jgi:hypothetical protein
VQSSDKLDLLREKQLLLALLTLRHIRRRRSLFRKVIVTSKIKYPIGLIFLTFCMQYYFIHVIHYLAENTHKINLEIRADYLELGSALWILLDQPKNLKGVCQLF